MSSKINMFLLSCLLFSAGFVGLNSAWAEQKRVFIIHSYEQNHICGQPQHDGALLALEEAGWYVGWNLQVRAYYMDTKKKNNSPELIEEQAHLAIEEMKKFRPDVVLTLDDNAFRTIALKYSDTAKNFVFSGLNGQPEMYDQQVDFMTNRLAPGGNITGVYEKLYIREAIQVLSTMHDMENFLFLEDTSPTGRAISTQITLEVAPDSSLPPLEVEVLRQTVASWEEFKEQIDRINKSETIDGFYLGTLLLKDSEGITHTAPEIIEYTINHAIKPAVGLNYAFIKLGLYGGATVDFFAMGSLAGEKVAHVLSGTAPGELPIEDAPRVALVFNLDRAEKLGLIIPPDILMAADEVFRK